MSKNKKIKTILIICTLIMISTLFYNIANYYILQSYNKNLVPTITNTNIKGTYLKIDKSKLTNINKYPLKDGKTLAFRNDTLTGSEDIKEISNFKFFGLEKANATKLHKVQTLKIKSVSGNNYYITDIKVTVKDNKIKNTIELSHVKSDVLKLLNKKPDKEIIIYDNLSGLKKDTIIELSDTDKISNTENAKEQFIDYNVENNTFYKYDDVNIRLDKSLFETIRKLIILIIIIDYAALLFAFGFSSRQ